MPDFLNGLFFSELLVDNAGNGAVNVNGQGGANKRDEFIEIQNTSGATVDLNGYQIWSDKMGLLHSFGPGDQVADDATATVVGSYTSPPAGFYGANGNTNGASGGGGFLEDGENSKFDTIYLVAPSGDYIQLSYGQPSQDPGALPGGFPAGGSRQGAGEALDTSGPNATSILRDADGNLTEGAPNPGTPGPVCFAAGTVIDTLEGGIAVEDLKPGARVRSKDQGMSVLRAIRVVTFGASMLRLAPNLRPVVIPAGVLGNTRVLRVSPPHRVLVSGWEPELLFGAAEVLVAARHLVGHGGVHIDARDRPVAYYHLLFDAHEVIRADGAWSESLFLGEATDPLLALSSGWQTQPGLRLDGMAHAHVARPTLRRHEAGLLASRMLRAPGAVACARIPRKRAA